MTSLTLVAYLETLRTLILAECLSLCSTEFAILTRMSSPPHKPALPSYTRLLLASGFGALVICFIPSSLNLFLRALVGWNVGVLVLFLASWWVIQRSNPQETAARAALEDPGREAVWAIALAMSLINLVGAIVVFRLSDSLHHETVLFWTLLSSLAVALSWALTHTSFALRYAHQHYESADPGFGFPGQQAPDDMDFAYFAFTIGMCFQVSDVSILKSNIRRTVLGHSLISFVYNTIVVALTLNLVLKFLG